MSIKSITASAAIVTLTLLSGSGAQAQGLQNGVNWQQSQIQQDVNAGAISGAQAQRLESRDAQIQSQAQQYMNQNGGTLTRGEREQIHNEMARNEAHLGSDLSHNSQGFNPAYAQQGQWNNPYAQQGYGAGQGMHHHHHGYGQGFGQQGMGQQGFGQPFLGQPGAQTSQYNGYGQPQMYPQGQPNMPYQQNAGFNQSSGISGVLRNMFH